MTVKKPNKFQLKNGIVSIALKHGMTALVDALDYELIKAYHWYPRIGDITVKNKSTAKYYAVTDGRLFGKGKTCAFMHRVVMGFPKESKPMIDHANGNGLDNRKCNLRICTPQQNAANKGKIIRKPNSIHKSKYRGVYRSIDDRKRIKTWAARITFNYKNINLGRFLTEEEAAEAYNKKAKELSGDFAYQNKIPSLNLEEEK